MAGSLSQPWPAQMPPGMPVRRASVRLSARPRAGSRAEPRASTSKASTIRLSPASTASGSEKARWTEGLPRRVAASSKAGRSSCTRLAQWISSSAAAAASAISGRSSPQAEATPSRIVGRMRAPPGVTA